MPNEAHFHLPRYVNKQFFRYWAPHTHTHTHTHSRTTKDHNTIQLEFNILNSQTTVSHTTSGPSTWLYDTGAVSSRPATIHIVCMSHTHCCWYCAT